MDRRRSIGSFGRSIGLRVVALATAAILVAACGGSSQTLTTSVEPSATVRPTPTPTPALTPSPAPAHGTFTLTGRPGLEDGRATLLQDGRVLIVGGYDDAMAELFDPETGTFTFAGMLNGARTFPTATLLRDGRVLVAGGKAKSTKAAELYDPAAGTFSLTGALVTDRMSHTATLLADGTVLIAGGEADFDGHYLASAEIYDPATSRFTKTGSMKTARENAQAVRLKDGRVLIVGGDQGTCGACDQFKPLASAEIYDPATGKFSPAGSMRIARVWHTATLLQDGRVLIAGGDFTFGTDLASAELYDTATGRFIPTGSEAVDRYAHTATLLLDGRVLLAGGNNDQAPLETKGTTSAELYDPTTGTFSPTGSLQTGRTWFTATLLKDGRVLMTDSGYDDAGLATAELYWP